MADIGEQLRKAREAKGMSLEDIEKITKIQYRYLKALENDDFDQLPGDFYARAFIKQYAQVVGLNGNELLNSLNSEVPESKPEEYVENSIDNKSEEVRRTTNNKKGLWRAYLPKAAAVIGIFLVIFVVYLVYSHFFAGSSTQQSANQESEITVSSSSEKSSKVTKRKTTKSTPSKIKLESLGNNRYRVKDWDKAKNRDLKLSTSTDASYAKVTVDNKVVWQGNLDKNSSRTVKLSKDVKNASVQFDNTKSTRLTLDGKTVKAQDKSNPNASMTISFVFGSEESKSTSKSASTVTNPSPSTNSTQSTYTPNTNSTTTNSRSYSTNSSQNSQPSQGAQTNNASQGSSTSQSNTAPTQSSQTQRPNQSTQQSTPTNSTTTSQGQTTQSTTGGQSR